MSRFILSVSLMSLVFIFTGCSHDTSGNGGVEKTQVLPDASDALFTGDDVKTVSDEDIAAEEIPSSDACKTEDGPGHKIIDSRLVPNYQFPRTTTVGTQNKRSFSEVFTILSATSDSYVVQDNYTLDGIDHAEKSECSFRNMKEGGHSLNCLNENGNLRQPAMPYLKAAIICHLESVQTPKIIKVKKNLVLNGKTITTFRSREETPGQLVCNGKPMGPGHTVETKVFSFDIPSLDADSCSPGQIYYHWKIEDLNKNIMGNRSMGITGFENLKPVPPSTGVQL